MIWQRVGKYGMQSGSYKVGKVFENGCTLYLLWHNDELLKACNDFDECKEIALSHMRTTSEKKQSAKPEVLGANEPHVRGHTSGDRNVFTGHVAYLLQDSVHRLRGRKDAIR